MDVVAHGLWTMAAASGARTKLKRPISLGWAVFWGVFPDLFSFAIPAVVRLWWFASRTPHTLLPQAGGAQHFQFVWQLYNGSHSLVIFAAVFGIVWAWKGRPVLDLCGWMLHVLIDIATHQGIFAVQFLWPVSSYAVNGIRWENWWFMATNYVLLCGALGWMWLRSRQPESELIHGTDAKKR